jgi:citrate lyase beta subunit
LPLPTDSPLESLRSLLFVPGDDPERLQAALESAADGVVADLEDGVPGAHKEEARRITLELLRPTRAGARLVRINTPTSPDARVDLAAIAALELDAIVVPKATPAEIAVVGTSGPSLVAVVESAIGLREAYEIASSPRVVALVLGTVDLATDLGLELRKDGAEVLYARSKLVVDSAAANIRPPFDRLYASFDDASGLEADALFGRSLGFGGKVCARLSQVDVTNRIFAPRPTSHASMKRAIYEVR